MIAYHCPTCGGSGTMPCPDCYRWVDDDSYCETCDNTQVIDCIDCDGTGG